MSLDIIGWLVGAVGALVAFLALRSRKDMSDKLNDSEQRISAIRKAKVNHENIQTLDDDRLIAEFDRLYNDRRR
mgnify:CR=1 FL=1